MPTLKQLQQNELIAQAHAAQFEPTQDAESPCNGLPGSKARVETYAARYRARQELAHAEDPVTIDDLDYEPNAEQVSRCRTVHVTGEVAQQIPKRSARIVRKATY